MKSNFKNFLKVLLLCFIFYVIFIADVSVIYEETEEVEFVIPEKVSPVIYKIEKINPEIDKHTAQKIVDAVEKWSDFYKIPQSLVFAMIAHESSFRPFITNGSAKGLMQVIPYWHQDKIKDAQYYIADSHIFDIETSVYLGTRIYRDCKRKYNSVHSALKCYNGTYGTNSDYAKRVLKYKKEFDSII